MTTPTDSSPGSSPNPEPGFTGQGESPPTWPATTASADPLSAGFGLPPDLATFPDPVPDHVDGDPSGRIKYLVGYDIRESTRLQRLHRQLKDYGRPIQYSVFECLLGHSELDRMWKMIEDVIDQSVDWVVLFRLHRPFDEAIRHIGHYDPQLFDTDDIVFI